MHFKGRKDSWDVSIFTLLPIVFLLKIIIKLPGSDCALLSLLFIKKTLHQFLTTIDDDIPRMKRGLMKGWAHSCLPATRQGPNNDLSTDWGTMITGLQYLTGVL